MADTISFDNKAASHILREELEALKDRIANNMRANGQVASGRTIQSMHVDVNEDYGALYGRKYFGVLETGRRAGRVPRNFTSIILQWMHDKGIHAAPIPYKTNKPHKYSEQERGNLSMASAIAHTIAAEGSLLHRTGGRDDVYSNVIPDTMKRIKQRLIFLIKQDFEHITLNTKKTI